MTKQKSIGLGRAIFSSGSLKLAQVFVGLFVSIIMVAALGAAEFGLYAFFVSIVSILIIPTTKGTSTLVVREVATGISENDDGLVRAAQAWGFRFNLVYAAIASAIFVFLGLTFFDIALSIAICVVLILFGQSMMANMLGVLSGRKKFTIALFPETVAIPVLVGGLMVIVANIANLQVDAATAMVIRTCAIWSVAVFVGVYVWRVFGSKDPAMPVNTAVSRNWLFAAIPFAIIGGMQVFNRQLGIVMLGGLATFEEVAIYRVADQMAMVAAFGVQAVNIATSPYYAELRKSLDPEKIRALMMLTSKVAMSVAIVVSLGAIVVGKVVLVRLYGPEFADAYLVLIILATSKIAPALSASGIVLLKMSGHERRAAWILGGAIVLNVVAGFILIPLYGVVGAAIASFIAVSVMAICVIVTVERHFEVSIFRR